MRIPIGRWDRALVRRSAQLPPSSADHALRLLTTSANHSRLWFGVAALLALRRGQARRGAIRGLAAIGLASFTANMVGKQLIERRRPAADLVPVHCYVTAPASSSFPSGHAASAAAFGTAVAMESPPAALAVLPLAAAVAYSRVHTGVHWPSDVAAGAMLGIGAGLITQHFSPVREDSPVVAAPPATAPALQHGERLLFVVNPHSGDGSSAPEDEVPRRWPKASVLTVDPDLDLVAELTARITADTVLGVAGGDGTVATVAGVAAEHGVPLVVLPAGTLNHFARDAGCTGDVSAAVTVDLATVTVDGGEHRWILNTASLGGYPELVRLREKLEHRIGKWPAAAVALLRVLRTAEPLHLELDGAPHQAWLLFVGNNAYLPREFTPAYRPSMASGLLDVRIVLAEGRCSRLRFALAALTGSLHSTTTYARRTVHRLTVRSGDGPVRLATDGEVGPRGSTFTFTARHRALRVYRSAP